MALTMAMAPTVDPGPTGVSSRSYMRRRRQSSPLSVKPTTEGVNRLRSPDRSMIVITHYQRLLEFIVPDVVHVLAKGKVVKSGGKELALELEAKGYAQFQGEAA